MEKAKSAGAIKNKKEFAKLVISQCGSFDELSVEAQKLTEEIYDFIKRKNQD